MVILITGRHFNHYQCAHTNLQWVISIHHQILHSTSVSFPSCKRPSRKAEFPLYYKTNQHSFSSLHMHWHLWELVSHGCMEITFPNATVKSGRCKWLSQLLLCLCSSAFGWCVCGKLGCDTAGRRTNSPEDARGTTKVHLQWTRQNEARFL